MGWAGRFAGSGVGPSAGPRPSGTTGRTRLLPALLLVWLGIGGASGPAAAQSVPGPDGELGVAATEDLVRQIHYEGLPEAEAARIGADGAARLAEMLADPEEKASHGRILLALGIAGQPGAYEAMMAWVAAQPPAGEVDRDRFRAWQILPFALGRLAVRDPRAIERLAACFDAAPPAWTFRHFDGERLRGLERRAAAGALAETGLPAAQRVLDAVERRAGDPALSAHVRAVRAEAALRRSGAPR